jgi:hypothetical protein
LAAASASAHSTINNSTAYHSTIDDSADHTAVDESAANNTAIGHTAADHSAIDNTTLIKTTRAIRVDYGTSVAISTWTGHLTTSTLGTSVGDWCRNSEHYSHQHAQQTL